MESVKKQWSDILAFPKLILHLFFWSLIVLPLLVIWIAPYFYLAEDLQRLRIAAGSGDGNYNKVAKVIFEECLRDEAPGDLVSTSGSVNNARLLSDGSVDLAILQNDTIVSDTGFSGDKIRSIAALYPEVLHLLVKRDAPVNEVDDLRGKRVGVGPEGSGTAETTKTVLEFVLGDDFREEHNVELVYDNFKAMLSDLRTGKIAALFWLSGLPSPQVERAFSDADDLKVVPLIASTPGSAIPKNVAERFADGLKLHHSYVAGATIPMYAYEGHPDKPVSTIGITAVLACNQGLSSGEVMDITENLFSKKAIIAQKARILNALDETSAQQNLHFPLHEGARQYYRRAVLGSFFERNLKFVIFLYYACACLASFPAILLIRRHIKGWRNHKRIDEHYDRLEAVYHELKTYDGCDLDEIARKLRQIRTEALGDLTAEILPGDNSFLVYQNFQNDCEQLLQTRMEEASVTKR